MRSTCPPGTPRSCAPNSPVMSTMAPAWPAALAPPVFGRRPAARGSAAADRQQNQAIREWAIRKGNGGRSARPHQARSRRRVSQERRPLIAPGGEAPTMAAVIRQGPSPRHQILIRIHPPAAATRPLLRGAQYPPDPPRARRKSRDTVRHRQIHSILHPVVRSDGQRPRATPPPTQGSPGSSSGRGHGEFRRGPGQLCCPIQPPAAAGRPARSQPPPAVDPSTHSSRNSQRTPLPHAGHVP